MQKLEERHANTPTDAPQVCSNCDSVIKHDCRVGQVLQNIKTSSNNSDVDQQSSKTEQDLRVPVLNMRGQLLMPTTPAKARHLLEQNKARVVSRKPFTIQLKYATGETKQPITLGVDVGYKNIGVSAVSDEKELFSAKVVLRTDIPKKLQNRAVYRRQKRNKLWYRQSRFDNRGISKGWLAPSIQHKLDSHIRIVEKVKKILPISEVIVEVASFDIQKMQNPEISGVEYQQGTLQGYNVRQYLLQKWNHKCAYCSKKNIPLEIEHIIPKSRGGSNRVVNLTISCHECNQKKGDRTAEEFGFPNLQKEAGKTYRDATFMNIIRWKIVDILGCKHTYGNITKYNRIKQGLDKSHVNDAFVIAGGTTQERCKPYIVKQVRRNNRKLQMNRKGFKPSIRRQHYPLQPNDIVKYNSKMHLVKGIHRRGKYVVISDFVKNLDVKIQKVELLVYGKGMQFLYPL
jgi:hypothetical protein